MAKYVQPNFIVDSSASFLKNVTFDSSVYLQGVTHISSPGATITNTPYALVVGTIGVDVSIQSRQLGTMTWETSTNYYGKTKVDALISDVSTQVDTRLDNIDLSLGTLNGLINTSITDINNLETSVGALNILTIIHDASIGALAAATVKSWNGLTTTNSSVGLGGTLNIPTIITTSATNSLKIAGLVASTANTPSALVMEGADGSLRVRTLGSMTWETSTNYYGKTYLDSSLNAIGTQITNINSSLGTFNTWDLNQDTSLGILNGLIQGLEASKGLFVLKAGDTMTGPLSITAGGLSVTNNASINGGLSVLGDTYIGGNLTVDGSLYITNIETIDVSASYIRLNTGLTGAPPAYMQSGIVIERGSSDPYIFVYDESFQTFRIGIAKDGSSFIDASTQAVATREDTPTAFGIGFWDGTKYRTDTSAGFTFTPGVGLGLPIATAQASEMTALVWNGTLVGSRDLGTMAFETSTNYYGKTKVDALISDVSIQVDTRLDYMDTSIVGLNTLTIVHTAGIADLSTNAIRAVANVANGGNAAIFSYENNNIAYLRQLVQGVGVSITSDTSTITITVPGAGGYVTKYAGAFDPTGISTFAIPAATHGLGAGPFTVAVYELRELVFTGVKYAANGDITLDWTLGSLTGDCSVFITG
jgi:hypothetical protein